MRFVSADEIAAVLQFPALIAAIADAFRAEITVPLRHHHAMARKGGEATLLLMPAWTAEGAQNFIGTKVATVFPGNVARGQASVTGTYLLMKGDSGEPLAAIDGRVFTLWRTAASSGRGRFAASRFGTARVRAPSRLPPRFHRWASTRAWRMIWKAP